MDSGSDYMLSKIQTKACKNLACQSLTGNQVQLAETCSFCGTCLDTSAALLHHHLTSHQVPGGAILTGPFKDWHFGSYSKTS